MKEQEIQAIIERVMREVGANRAETAVAPVSPPPSRKFSGYGSVAVQKENGSG